MRIVLMLVSTGDLVLPIRAELPSDAQLTAVTDRPALLAASRALRPSLVVLEWPIRVDPAWPVFVTELRQTIGGMVPFVVVTRSGKEGGRVGREAALLGVSEIVLFRDREPIGLLVRAVLGDQTGVRAAVIVLRHMLSRVPVEGHAILRTMLADGWRYGNVKTVAASLGRHYTTLETQLRRVAGPRPGRIIASCTAGIAIVLLRTSARSIADVASLVGYRRSRSLKTLLEDCVGMPAQTIRMDRAALAPADYLRKLRSFSSWI